MPGTPARPAQRTKPGCGAKLARDEARLDDEPRRFLPRAYDLKTIADQATGEDAAMQLYRAEAALAMAGRFVACIAAILG